MARIGAEGVSVLDAPEGGRVENARMVKRRDRFTLALVMVASCGADTDALRTRAAFDFQCTKDKLALTELSSGRGSAALGAVYGVEGCGHRATYVQPTVSTWIMNTVDGKATESGGK
jgi:hypothetical protein